MSLRRMKTLYCIAIISVAIVLAFLGQWATWIMSVLLLASALPSWSLIGKSWKAETLTALEQRRVRANPPVRREETSAPPDRADIPHANHR